MRNHQTDLTDYLRGLARANGALAENFASYAGWQELARRVVDREREDFLRRIPRGLLLAIAAGEADPAVAARAVLSDQSSTEEGA